jgi:hypothetical protein
MSLMMFYYLSSELIAGRMYLFFKRPFISGSNNAALRNKLALLRGVRSS